MKHIYKTLSLILSTVLLLVGCAQKADSSKELRSEADLPGAVIGVSTGTIYDIKLTPRKDITLMRHPSEANCIASLKNGRIETFVTDEVLINKDICREQGIRVAFRTEEVFQCVFGMRKEDAELTRQFNAMLAEMRESGEMDRIRDKWTHADDYNNVVMSTDTLPEPQGTPIRIGTNINMAPMAFLLNGKWRGMEVELQQRFARYIGRPVKIDLFEFAALAPALQSGTIDIMSGVIFDTEERRQALSLTDSYYTSHGAYFVLDHEAHQKVGFWGGIKRSLNNNLLVENRWQFLAKGLWVTIRITLCSILFGSLLGAGLYLMRKSRRKWVNTTAQLYSTILQGIPMVVLLMILFYIFLTGFNAVVVAIVAFSMTFASFVASIMDTSITAVGTGQQEAGVALGFTRLQTFRYIIGPQALKKALPHFKSESVSLIKNTSIVGYIAIQDLTRASDMIRSRTFEAFFPLLLITIVYFILAWLMGKLLNLLFKIGTKI